MNDDGLDRLKAIDAALTKIISEVLNEEPCPLYAGLEMADNCNTVRLSGNAEGLAYLASTLVSLALARLEGQHVHLGPGEVLDVAKKDLIIMYHEPDWNADKGNRPG